MMKDYAADVGIGMRIYIETEVTGGSGSSSTSLKQTIVGAVGVMKGNNE